MGKPMARNLLKKGFSVLAHSRSQGPVDELVKDGATAAGSPAEVARAAKFIITMLPDGPDVEKVLEGDGGVFGAMSKGHRHRRLEHDRAGDRPAPCRARQGVGGLDARRAGQRWRDRRHRRHPDLHGRRRRRGARIGARDPQRDGQARKDCPRRRVRRGPNLQGLQSDRAGRDDVGRRRGDRLVARRPASIR